MTITRPQRVALARIYARGPLVLARMNYRDPNSSMLMSTEGGEKPISYHQFRRAVRPMFGGQGCVLLPWQGMWLGIEPDGYTHS